MSVKRSLYMSFKISKTYNRYLLNLHLEDLDLDGRIILKWIFEKWVRSMDRVDPAQDRDRWRTVVKAVINLCFSKSVGNFLTS
jgi:hypothetical protein